MFIGNCNGGGGRVQFFHILLKRGATTLKISKNSLNGSLKSPHNKGYPHPAVVAWSVKASNSHIVEVCTSALGGSNPAWGRYTRYTHVLWFHFLLHYNHWEGDTLSRSSSPKIGLLALIQTLSNVVNAFKTQQDFHNLLF